MRIGIDGRTLEAEQLKGIGHYLQALLQQMLRANGNHEYVVFTDARRPTAGRVPDNAHVRRVPVEAPADELWEQWALPRAARKHDVNILHAPANAMMLRPACPTVLTLHDLNIYDLSKAWGRREHLYWEWVQRAACRQARRIIAPSQYTKDQIIQRLGLPAERIVVIPNGISPEYGPRDPAAVQRRLDALGVRRPFLFAAGGKVRHKNLPALLRAYDRVAEADLSIGLVLSSARGLAPVEAERATLRASERVQLLDYLPQEDMIALYNAASVVVYPSLAEGFGFPPVEAMACGAPVVASMATCIPEVVGDGAVLVDCTKPELIADAVLALLRDPAQREALRRRGPARAAQFRWERAAAQTLEVYHQVAAG